MYDPKWVPKINQFLCNGCGACIETCPTAALGWQAEKAILAYPEKCIYCAYCETICPQNAIELPYLILHYEEDSR
jgi:NAD-dependent dihydropyrimidine dehydrogenase PreA subunit